MVENEISISRLYYNYKSADDDKIRRRLSDIKIVKEENKGIGTMHGYYPLTEEAMQKIIDNPRGISTTFTDHPTTDEPLINVKSLMKFPYLVKSSSRFFLKPDIGEVFDQLRHENLYRDDLRAICIHNEYELLEGTEGEHFIMYATLLIDK